MNNIGNVIAKLRKTGEMTQEELSLKIGVTAQTISKWETGNAMPDILLLPVIADVFDVTVDFLFGKEIQSTVFPIGSSDYAEKAYKEFMFTMTRGFMYKEMPADAVWAEAMKKTEHLERRPKSQTLIKYQDRGGTYANKDLGIVWRHNDRDSLRLLEDVSTEKILAAFANENFRKIMIYQIQNPNASFTANAVASKCKMAIADAKNALEDLVKYNFTDCLDVDLGEESVNVYRFKYAYKMILVFTMLSLAERLANYEEWYEGMNC